MKNTPKKIILGILSVLVLCATQVSAQPGNVCSSAYLGSVSSTRVYADYPLVSNAGTWVRFTATTSDVAIHILPPASDTDTLPAHIHSLKLYSGACGSLNLVGLDSVAHGADTLPFLKAKGLSIGSTYLIHVQGFSSGVSCSRCEYAEGYFNLAIAASNKPEITSSSSCAACGVNLIPNGDFETPQVPGNTPYPVYGGTTSDMDYIGNTFGWYQDEYTVSKDVVYPHNVDPADEMDHTTGSGHFFWGDSRSKWSNGQFNIYQSVAWERNVWVTSGKHYVFSLWIKDVGQDYDLQWTQFKIQIDGQDISGWFDNGSSKTWHQFCFDYTAGTTANVKIEIINKGAREKWGNDFGIDDIAFREDNFNSNIYIVTNSPAAVCPGQSVTLTGGGGSNYSWSTGATTQSIVVNPMVTTTYTVTGYPDVAGCEGNAATYTVYVTGPPSCLFTFDPTACTNVSVAFTNLSTSVYAATYSWNFGDGSAPNTTTSPTYNYTDPGTYTVTLTGTSACGTNSYSLPISVIPSSDAYNANCCSESQSYTHDNPRIIEGAPIATPEVWSGVHYYVRGWITIYPGNELDITNNSVIEFDPLSGILVLPGGILKVEDSKLTGLASCGTMWQGIQNAGDNTKNQSQVQNTTTGQLYQGKVILNNATIELAHNGVVQGRLNNNGLSYNPTSGGGILIATNSQFINCGYGVKFVPYPFANQSTISHCDFSCTTLPDPGYSSLNSYTYPNAWNSTYANANYNQRTYANIQAIGVKFVKVYDNQLDNAEYGVMGINSNLRVGDGDNDGLGNDFENITNGEIHANFLTTPFYANQIFNNQYSGQNTPVLVPIQVWSGIGDRMTNNNIYSAFVGIGAVNSGALLINDNTIGNNQSSCLIGVSTQNSGTMGGLIGFNSTGNIFTHCTNGTYLGGSNQFLQVHCNRYNNPTGSIYARNWYNGGTLANQGYLPIIDDKDPAGNTFVQTFPLRNDLYSTTMFDYYAHSADPNGVSVTVIPAPLAASGNALTNSNMVNTGIQETSISCIPAPPCTNCTGRIAQAETTVSTLRSEMNTLSATIDGGQTEYLLRAIDTVSSSSALETILLANSPLSDEVLLAFIARGGTPPAIVQSVVVANSPVSAAVRPVLYDAVTGTSIYAAIVAAQSNYSNRTPSVVYSELLAAMGDRQQLYNQQQYYYLDQLESDSKMIDSLNLLLAQQGTEAAKQALAASYIDQQKYDDAESVIKTMSRDDAGDAAAYDLLLMLNDLYRNGRDIYSMIPAEEDLVRSISIMDVECVAKSNAKVILFVLYAEPLEMEFDFGGGSLRQQAPPVGAPNSNASYLGESYPNPATTQVSMQCAVPEGETAILSIFDMNGKLVYTQTVAPGKQIVTVNTANWTEGVYMCSLDTDTERIGLQKIVVVNKQ
jgi:PKD repeat protein